MSELGYSMIIGGVMWAVNATRPDIDHATQVLSQFMQNPGDKHCQVVKHLLRYLKATKTMGITYHCDVTFLPDSYCNADLASDINT